MPGKIFVDENIPQGREAFSGLGEVVPFAGRDLKKSDLTEADALMVRSITLVDASLLEDTPVQFVGTATIGTDHIDLNYLNGRDIAFTAAPGCNADAVKDYVTAALLALREKGYWTEGSDVLGIVGCGHVGSRTAIAAEALGLRVLRYDPPRQEREPGSSLDSLQTLRETCTLLTFHVPLSRSGPYATQGMVDAAWLSSFPNLNVVVNTCRGEVVIENDLLTMQKSGRLKALVLDVFENEPAIAAATVDSAFFATPHIAGHSVHGKLNGTLALSQAYHRFCGRTPAWNPRIPTPLDQQIVFSSGFGAQSDLDFISHCYQRVYPIHVDDASLRRALREPDPAIAFDSLRKRYPIRFETRDFEITEIPSDRKPLREKLVTLGFQVL